MKLYTYVNFAGNCAEAFRFYEAHVSGKIGMMMTHGRVPDQSKVDPALKDAVPHARISIGGTELLGADIPMEATCSWRCRNHSSQRDSASCAIASA